MNHRSQFMICVHMRSLMLLDTAGIVCAVWVAATVNGESPCSCVQAWLVDPSSLANICNAAVRKLRFAPTHAVAMRTILT